MKFKKKKSRRMRASTFHGYGRGAAHHKGSGNRGGKGNAGSGKKSDGKKPSYWKLPEGKFGFTTKSRFQIKAINVATIQDKLDDFVASGAAQKNGSNYTLDLKKAGYDKLLSSGKLSSAVAITVDYASKSAAEKVKQAGGSLTVLKKKVKKVKKKAAAPKKKAEDAKADAE